MNSGHADILARYGVMGILEDYDFVDTRPGYAEGKDARRFNLKLSENPFVATSPEHKWWIEGWQDEEGCIQKGR